MDEVTIAEKLRHQAYAQKELLSGENDVRLRVVPVELTTCSGIDIGGGESDTGSSFLAADQRSAYGIWAAQKLPGFFNFAVFYQVPHMGTADETIFYPYRLDDVHLEA